METIKRYMGIASIVTILVISLTVSAVKAENVTGCQALSVTGTTYELNQSFDGAVTNCLNFLTDNVTLDCHGYTITGDYGNKILMAAAKVNITIRNCNAVGWQIGLSTNAGASNITVDNSTFRLIGGTISSGFSLVNSVNIKIYDTEISNATNGLYFWTTSDNTVVNVSVYNSTNGIRFTSTSTNTSVINGSILGNTIDYKIEQGSGLISNFTNTNFTGARVIEFDGVTSGTVGFNYRNDTSTLTYLKTNTSSVVTVTRTLALLTRQTTTWTDALSTSSLLNYSMTDLTPSTTYVIYVNGTFLMTKTTSSSGDLPMFGITMKYGTINITSSPSEFVGECNATVTTPSVKFAFFNETIDFGAVNSSIEMVLTGGSGNLVFNTSTTNTTYSLCIYAPGGNYSINGHVRYSNTSYSQRDYFFERMPFDNTSDTKNLYLLNSVVGSRVKFIVKDSTGNLYPDVIINIQRYYPSTYEYRTVAAPKTDTIGETLTYLVPYDVYYRYVLTKDGTVLYTSAPALISASEITINTEPGALSDWLKYGSKITGSCAYSATTGNVTCAYTDTSGYLTGTDLEVRQIGALINSVVCTNTSSTVPNGHISCHFGNATGSIYKYTLTGDITDGNTFVITEGMLNEGSLTTRLFGNCGSVANIGSCREGLVIALLMVLTAALIGIYSPPISIAFMMMVVGTTWYIGLLAISIEAFIGLVFVALIMVFRLSRGES